MGMDCQIEVESKYVLLSCQGDYDTDELIEVCRTAFELAAKEGLRAVIVDGRKLQGEPPTTTERYRLGDEVSNIQLKNGFSAYLAMLGREPMVDPQRFGELVAANRGGIVKAFTDFDDALAWTEERVE